MWATVASDTQDNARHDVAERRDYVGKILPKRKFPFSEKGVPAQHRTCRIEHDGEE